MSFSLRSKWTLLGIVVLLAETPSLVSIRQVSGSSMKPTLNPDISTQRDYVLINKTPVTIMNYKTIRRGDVVSIRSIEDPKQINVKRVIGLPGDTIVTRGLNPGRQIVVPEGRIWIEGDESFRSRDSNAYGPVPMGCVHGRVVGILWPFNRFGRLAERRKASDQ